MGVGVLGRVFRLELNIFSLLQFLADRDKEFGRGAGIDACKPHTSVLGLRRLWSIERAINKSSM